MPDKKNKSSNEALEARLRNMGFSPARRRDPDVIARSLRKENGGAFGNLSTNEKLNRGVTE